jgi:D-amino peptidase
LLKAFISVDMEGLPHVVSYEHMTYGRALYDEGRRIMTDCVLAVVEELKKSGVNQVIVADSHGPMVSLIPERMPSAVSIVRGTPRRSSMVAGSKGCDFGIFLGYHAKAGSVKSTFDHTIAGGTIARLSLNGVQASEFLICSACLGDLDIPVVMVAGDRSLVDGDVRKFAPWSVRVAMKDSLNTTAAISPSMPDMVAQLKEGTSRAVTEFNARKMKPLRLKEPIVVQIDFVNSANANIASALPGSQRVGGNGVRFKAKDAWEAFAVTELLLYAAIGAK